MCRLRGIRNVINNSNNGSHSTRTIHLEHCVKPTDKVSISSQRWTLSRHTEL